MEHGPDTLDEYIPTLVRWFLIVAQRRIATSIIDVEWLMGAADR